MPGDVSIAFTYQEARLLLALGDTAAAARHVADALDALPALATDLLEWEHMAAGLVRAMALHAELASSAHDRDTARRWARAVVALWSNADDVLRETVDRMRSLASARTR